MNKEEATKILKEQFKLLSEESKKCEPEYLEGITSSMLSIYNIIYPWRP